jgi:hypothetical protein
MKTETTYLPTGHLIEFNIGQTVYIKTDPDQLPRIITAITLRPTNSVTYCLSFSTNESWHYAMEIDSEKDILQTTNN